MAVHRLEHVVKFISKSGLCSRRKAQNLVLHGRVSVNGELCKNPAVRVAEHDKVEVNGTLVQPQMEDEVRLWRYHKPRGLICTHHDPKGRPTLYESLPPQLPFVKSIGRLDVESEGLILLTNSSQLAHKMELPTNHYVRRYWVELSTGDRGVTNQVRIHTVCRTIRSNPKG